MTPIKVSESKARYVEQITDGFYSLFQFRFHEIFQMMTPVATQ